MVESSQDAVRPSADALAIPVNPVMQAALRALYSGAYGLWDTGPYGSPLFNYRAGDGHISLFYEFPPNIRETKYSQLFMCPRAARSGFITAHRFRQEIFQLSAETGDILIILLAEIARLHNPARDIARVSLEDIADYRGVRLRNGSKAKLFSAIKRHVLLIANLRLRMTWRDYSHGSSTVYGADQADRLLDIVDIDHRQHSRRRTSFEIRSGQALTHFLNPDTVRWIGYYNKPILRLSPYHDALTKKIGAYWTILGTIAGKRGRLPRATPRHILQFCGVLINKRNPGHTIDAFISAHNKLLEYRSLQTVSAIEPLSRSKGYLKAWLDTPVSVKLSDHLWQLQNREVCRDKALIPVGACLRQTCVSEEQICRHPHLIKELRNNGGLHQEELARAVGISRQTLSRYERGLQLVPPAVAGKLAGLFYKKAWR